MVQISGLVAWYFLIVEVIVGTMLSGGVAKVTAPYGIKLDLHIVTSAAVCGAVLFHIETILVSRYHGWGWRQVTMPSFPGSAARDLGVLAAWVLVLVIGTAVARRFIPHRIWLRIHKTVPFLVLLLGTAHGLLAGTQGTTLPVILPAVAALTVLGCVFAVRWNVTRTLRIRRPPPPRYKHQMRKR